MACEFSGSMSVPCGGCSGCLRAAGLVSGNEAVCEICDRVKHVDEIDANGVCRGCNDREMEEHANGELS